VSRFWYRLAAVPLAAVLAFALLHLHSGAAQRASNTGLHPAALHPAHPAEALHPASPSAHPTGARPTHSSRHSGTSTASPSASQGAAPGAGGSQWRLVYSTDFSQNAPLGSFSDCDAAIDTCEGLPKALQSQWWAYPDGWPDSSTLRGEPVHGYYSPSTTVWIAGGMMNIRLWRGTGNVHSAAVMPKAALDRTYGEYVETFRVPDPVAGYKSAHMLHSLTNPTDGSAHEIDFPESGWGAQFSAFIHYNTSRTRFAGGARFDSSWTTTIIKWTPNGISFYVNGRMIGSVAGRVSDVPMRWILQNETQTNGTAYPPTNSSSMMQIKYVAYYAWVG
jgi:hypothetical protein